jgi:glycosyltransferase involved in cell wall biosynthesis
VCNAAVLQKQDGYDVRLLCRQPLIGEDAHYQSLLYPFGISARRIGHTWNDEFESAWKRSGLRRRVLRTLPPDLARTVANLVGELLTDPVDVLHCYVDDCTIPGAIAAVLTGTPSVVLSFRNGNPTHFPGLVRPWMKPWYEALVGYPGLVFSSNSKAGARDYETWLDLPKDSVPVVRNAFTASSTPAPQEAAAWRQSLGIAPNAPVVAGVFRMQPEKRPLYFLDVVRRIRLRTPGLRVVLAGVGSLEAPVRETIEREGLGEWLLYLGQIRDVPLLLAASDVLLLTSDWEGTPNILLEAQHFGCVPVVTETGGSAEALVPNLTGILVNLDDPDAATEAVHRLLADRSRRHEMQAQGRMFVAQAFAPANLLAGNKQLYAAAASAA